MPGAELLLALRCGDEQATDTVGAAIGAMLGRGDVVCLRGELGAGKTRMVRGIARGAGVDPAIVSSPTFVVMHDYPPIRQESPGLVHVDAYRLRGADELDTLGWDRVTGPGAPPLVIEWPERIEAALSPGTAHGVPQPGGGALRMDVAIGVESETSRQVELRGDPAWRMRPGWVGVARLGNGHAASPARRGSRPCAICGEPVAPDGPSFPFCSERCRMADLGRWFSGEYGLSRDLAPEDAEDAGA